MIIFFFRALPQHLRLSVAAQDPETVSDCVEIICKLCIMIDNDEDLNEVKKIRRVDKPRAKKGSYGGTTSQNSDRNAADSTTLCWDCGKADHRRNKCPEHFKYKPKSWANRGDQTSV